MVFQPFFCILNNRVNAIFGLFTDSTVEMVMPNLMSHKEPAIRRINIHLVTECHTLVPYINVP